MHAMSIFSLRTVDMATAGRHVQDSVVGAEDANVDEKLKTLAAAFTIDLHALSSQFRTVRHIAQTTAISILNCSDRDAWRRALLRCIGQK